MRMPEQSEPIRRDRRQYPYVGVEPDENGVYPTQIFDEDDEDDEDVY